MSEYIITDKQFKTATEAYLEHELSLPITEVFISGDKLPEIVRCRDCKWFMSERKSETRGCFEILHPAFCNKHITNTEPDGFCAWGERRKS